MPTEIKVILGQNLWVRLFQIDTSRMMRTSTTNADWLTADPPNTHRDWLTADPQNTQTG